MFAFSSKSTKDEKPLYICVSCGELDCKHRHKVYRFCYLKEHITKVCRKTGGHSVQPDSLQDYSDLERGMHTIFELRNVSTPDRKVSLKIEGMPTEMQLDAVII